MVMDFFKKSSFLRVFVYNIVIINYYLFLRVFSVEKVLQGKVKGSTIF